MVCVSRKVLHACMGFEIMSAVLQVGTQCISCRLALLQLAQVGTNYYQQWEFIRDFSDRPMHTAEAVLGAAAKDALDVAAGLVVVVSRSGKAARLVAKYRPRVPVLVITDR
jgi:pyruvate kinase